MVVYHTFIVNICFRSIRGFLIALQKAGVGSFLLTIALGTSFSSIFFISDSRAEGDSKTLSLENEVRQLKARVNLLESPPERKDYEPPKLILRGFGHFQYDVETGRDKDGNGNIKTIGDTNHFTLGGVNLFITSQIARNLFFLNETVFEYSKDGSNILDVERVLLKYEVADWLKITMGRGHTALGFWNQRYHHGVWLQTTTDRPILYRFEDDGGVLPIHFVGVEAQGVIRFGLGKFSYTGNIANGRGKVTDEVQLIEDKNDSKMLSAMFTFEPYFLTGFGVGVNILSDVIPDNPGVAGRSTEIDETISGVHLFWIDDPVELIVEFSLIHHNSIVEKTHAGGYFQLGYQLGDIKPYYRFDYLEIEEGDSFFAGLAGVEDTKEHTVGLRYEWFPFAAVKMEYRKKDSSNIDSHAGTVQVSFAF